MSTEKLRRAITAIKAGDKKTGRKLLSEVVGSEPGNEAAWLWMTRVVDNDDRRRQCLEQVLSINPGNQKARQLLDRLQPAPVDFPEIETRRCPHCAETIKAEAQICRFCGRDLSPKPKKWYMSTEVKIITFLFLTPLWALIVLDDPDSTTGVKIVAALLLIFYVLFICFPVLGVY